MMCLPLEPVSRYGSGGFPSSLALWDVTDIHRYTQRSRLPGRLIMQKRLPCSQSGSRLWSDLAHHFNTLVLDFLATAL